MSQRIVRLAFVPKPFSLNTVAGKIRTILDARYLRPGIQKMTWPRTSTRDLLSPLYFCIGNSLRKTRKGHQFSSGRKFVLVCLGFFQWRGVRAV